jgi:hypothetical protein
MKQTLMKSKYWVMVLLGIALLGSAMMVSSCGSSSPSSPSSGGSSNPTSTPTATFVPNGYLYTQSNKIYLSNGTTGTQWMGRGVNMDDIFCSGYNYELGTFSPASSCATTLEQVTSNLVAGMTHINFIRISLAMNSGYDGSTVVSWTGNTGSYATYMTNAINYILTTYPNVYVLLTLRSDGSMIDEDSSSGDAEATGLPAFPGTSATYKALVDAFGSKPNIIFGLSNEPGGNTLSNSVIATAMNNGVSVIRAEEAADGYQQHLVSVQGQNWTGDLSYYTSNPVTFTDVVYELHYYPDGGYTSSAYSAVTASLPMIVGEYGGFNATYTQASFESDMENDHIPNLAWEYEPFNGVTDPMGNASNVSSQPVATTYSLSSPWGTGVASYILNP